MTARPLRIGVSACFFHADPNRPLFKGKTLLYAEESMLAYVMRAGALPVLLPRASGGVSTRVLIDDVDALILHGGADMAPESYGETPLRPEWSGDRARDIYDLDLIRHAMDANRPVLGICRGHQVVNVSFGGTLFQDIELLHPEKRVHRNWTVYEHHGHEVHVASGTWLQRAYAEGGAQVDASGTDAVVRVNSIHHQGVNTLGRDLVVEALSFPDRIVEAIRYCPAGADATADARLPFVYGVQWHPEFMNPAADDGLLPAAPLLTAFLREANTRRAARGV